MDMLETATPLEEFFAQYAAKGFVYDSSASPSKEFGRLARKLKWGKKTEKREQAHDAFQDAIVKQFNNIYGTDVNDIASWRVLCARLGMDPLPECIQECRKTLKQTHVNLVDLTQAVDRDSTVTTFATIAELRKYSRDTGRIFPKENVHAGSLLRHLLRPIFRKTTRERE